LFEDERKSAFGDGRWYSDQIQPLVPELVTNVV